MVYGFRDCTACGSRVNEDKDEACPNCGAKVTKMAPKHAGGRPAREPWSSAYLRECPNGHKYTPKERSCPECAPSPENYLARALAACGWIGRPLALIRLTEESLLRPITTMRSLAFKACR